MSKQIVTRIAPSPTGLLHLGTYRTAVFAYLYAKKMGGKFIVRIEDTDKARSKEEYKENILDSLAWLSLSYDALYIQSENLSSHTTHLLRIIEEGKAYISKEEAKDGSGNMREVVRLKNKGEVVSFKDIVRGTIEIDTTDLGDFVIAKSVTEPLFHLAVVIDDHEEGVTHVIRGEDHIANTPRQILISRALGFPSPEYAHLPLVLSKDRTKLSKRKGALPVTSYRDMGYLPEALLNFMAFTGWNPGGEREIYSKNELIELFDLEKIHKGGAIFNEEKLAWMNKEHIRLQKEEDQLTAVAVYFKEYDKNLLKKLLPTIIDRISAYGELASLEESEFRFFIKKPSLTKESLEKITWKDKDLFDARKHLNAVMEILSGANFFSVVSIKEAVMPYAEVKGKGEVLWPLRMSLSGQEKSVDPFTICYVLGKEETITRIKRTCEAIDS